jgi:hypothetical protein
MSSRLLRAMARHNFSEENHLQRLNGCCNVRCTSHAVEFEYNKSILDPYFDMFCVRVGTSRKSQVVKKRLPAETLCL